MSKRLLKLCSIVLTLVMLFNMLPHQVLADTLSAEELDLPSGEITVEAEELDTSTLDVVEEITDKRTEFSKEFKMSNGLHMAAVYDFAVHYEKDGVWEEIDNTLIATVSGTDSVYSNTAGVWNITFPQQLSSANHITITKDGYTLRFGMAGQLTNNGAVVMSEGAATMSTTEQINTGVLAVQEAQASMAQVQQVDTAALRAEAEHPETIVDKLNSRLQYSNVYNNTSIVYDLQSNKLKESVIIRRYDSNLRGYRYTLDVGTMIPVLNEDNSIWFYDSAQEEVVMVMPAPFMLDANNVYCEDVEVALHGSGSTYTLIYMLPQDWLAADDRSWPVVLDPVITANISPSNIRDISVGENYVFSQTAGSISCGWSQDWGVYRFFVKYNEIPELKSSDVIVHAVMELYKFENSVSTDPVEVHKVNSTWASETITWDNKPGFNANVEDFAMVGTSGFYYWNVTDIVRDWYSGQNTGMMFKVSDAAETSGSYKVKHFYSSDYGWTFRPTLAVYFRNNNGLESYWDYTSASAGRAGTGYINNYTGNLVWVHNDIGFGGNRMPVSISHVYNANNAVVTQEITEEDTNRFGMGHGWRTNFNQRVYQWSENSNYYVWEDSDGTDHYFQHASYGTYKDEDGLELTLTTTGSGNTKYCITDKSGNKSYFDTNGRLTSQVNNQQSPSTISITYTTTDSWLISTITDGVGRVYTFTYSGDLLNRITCKGTDSTEISHVTFGYNSGSNLTSITNNDGKAASYGYSGNLLTSATDIDGYKLSYTYSAPADPWQPYRILSVEESDDGTAGGKLKFEYAHNQTTITDCTKSAPQPKQIIQFNNWGNTIAIQDGEGHAQYAQYATDSNPNTGKGNQLRVASKLQNTVANLLPDNSFELGTNWEASGATVSNAAGTAYFGSKALKVVTTSAGGAKTTFTAEPGKTYTFSGYVKTGSSAAYLTLGGKSCDHLAANSGWTRLEVSYTNSTGTNQTVTAQVMNAGGGTTYLDCVQVEVAPTASRYNLIVNGDFRDASAWSSSSGRATVGSSAAPQLSTNAYKLSGTYNTTNRVSQTVNVSGNEGDTFVLAGWAMGNATPQTAFSGNTYDSSAREFGIIAVFNYTDGSKSDEMVVPFNPDVDNWQYAAVPIVAKKAYSSITVYLAYDHNANDVYFDGIQLFKEQFGNSYTYDEDGNVKSVVDLQKQTTTYEYDANSNLTQMLQGNVSKMTYTYDDYHNVLTASDANGTTYNFTYDAYGNNTSVSTTSGGITMTSSATYSDDGNRMVFSTDAAGNVTTYEYDANTNVLLSVKYPKDTDATKTVYQYDEMYRVATAAASTGDVTLSAKYTYDDDYLTKITTGSTTYGFEYGNFGLRSSVKVGNLELAHYTYESGTNYLKTLDYGNGDSVQYAYDDVGRLTKETYDGGANVAYAYDNDGGLATVTDSATGIKTTYYYDFVDRLSQYTQKIGDSTILRLEYGYDLENRLTTEAWFFPGSNAYLNSYTYNPDGTVQGMGSGVMGTGYSYDGLGRLTRIDSEIDVSDREYTYRTEGTATTGQVTKLNYPILKGGYSFEYTYDANGNIATYTTSYPSTSTTTYTYDKRNQLIEAKGSKTYTYEYDDAGNIVNANGHTYTYGNSNWGDLLTKFDGQTISYDNIGNPTSYYNGTHWEFTWQNGRELTNATSGSTSVSYTYNADGMRKTKNVNGVVHTYYYNGGTLLREVYGDTILDFFYNANGTPIAMRQGSKTSSNYTIYYYITNLQGDVIRLVDVHGNTAAYYNYDPYGKPIEASGSHANINPLRYRGYVYDSETELYYLQSRYYDPAIGRFINADVYTSTGQGLLGNNMFAYCLNNPSNYYDNDGQDAVWIQEKNSAVGAGHSGLLIQDADGNWWYFYWGPADPKASFEDMINGTTPICVLVMIDTEKTNLHNTTSIKLMLLRLFLDADPDNNIRQGEQWDDITGTMYFYGDYTPTYEYLCGIKEKADSGELNYQLFSMNCSQISSTAMAYSDQRFGHLWSLVPNVAYSTITSYFNPFYLLTKQLLSKAVAS